MLSCTCYHTHYERSFSMSNQHKHPTISFRISDAERKQIEARILASGMMKKDYFVRSCIYNRICVVGKKETIYPLVQTVNALNNTYTGTPLTISCKKCNSSVLLDTPDDIAYLYRLAQESPLLYAELACKPNGLQEYVNAMNEFN